VFFAVENLYSRMPRWGPDDLLAVLPDDRLLRDDVPTDVLADRLADLSRWRARVAAERSLALGR